MNTIVRVIDVLPLKSGNFGKPQARSRDQERHSAFRLLHPLQDCEGLLGREDHRFVVRRGFDVDLAFQIGREPFGNSFVLLGVKEYHHHHVLRLAPRRGSKLE